MKFAKVFLVFDSIAKVFSCPYHAYGSLVRGGVMLTVATASDAAPVKKTEAARPGEGIGDT